MAEPSDEVIKEFFGLSSEDIAALDEWLHVAGQSPSK